MKTMTNPPSTLQGQYAGFISRLIAYTIDLLVVIATITIVGITVEMFLRFFRLDQLIDTLLESQNIVGDVLRFLTLLGSIAFISFSYFVLIWTFTAGQSVYTNRPLKRLQDITLARNNPLLCLFTVRT
jgi:uncharacterized RDD family membrane protein YckC